MGRDTHRQDSRQLTNKLYKGKRWRRLRNTQLTKQPFCQCPEHEGRYVEADIVDHIKPHRGDLRLFYDPDNLQSMTKHCHDSYKQKLEGGRARSIRRAFNATGYPLDPEHHWNKGVGRGLGNK
jgi:5-methylcytosine-specific restriction protein A